MVVLARLVLVGAVLTGGVLPGTGLVTRDVLQCGDELTDTELRSALLLSLVVAGVVILLVGAVALTGGELPRLTLVSVGRLLVGGVLSGAVLRLPWLLAGLLLRACVLARPEWRTVLLLRLFIVAAAALCVRGLLVGGPVLLLPVGVLADRSVLLLLRAGRVLRDAVRLTRVDGVAARLASGERRDLTVAEGIGAMACRARSR